MLEDFFVRALIAGVGVAIVAGPLGCFIVWRRMSYFGDTMSHAALLGVALALVLEINVMLGVLAITLGVGVALLLLQRQNLLPTDALLGLLAHSTLALGLVLLAFMAWLRVDLLSYLFGDILAVSVQDLALIYGGGAFVLGALAWIWRPLLADTVSPELAQAEGLDPARSRLVFMGLIATVIAIAMKVVGVILITALLIIPAATARRFARTPEQMAVLAALAGAFAAAAGLAVSLVADTPSGPSIIVTALALFIVGLVPWPTLFAAGAERR